jgi:alkylation response protein AidB-like acyl-CoA dehydrogenase
MAELGWLGILVPERLGGLGLGLAEAAIVAEVLAGALTPEPFNAVAVMAATALAEALDNELATELLTQIASGELRAVVAWQERPADLDVAAIDTRADADGAGWKLDGVKRFVAGASAAHGFIVSAATPDGPALYWVLGTTAGLEVTCETLADGRAFGTLRFDGVNLSSKHRLAFGETAISALERARDYGTIAAAAELRGVMDRALAMTLEHMRNRVQFGKPIGAFQGLQHRAVDLFVQQQLSSAVLHDCLRRLGDAEEGGRLPALASRVKARCSDAALKVVKETIQIHGAIGFTDEFDAGLYFKRALALAGWLGNAGFHRRRYATLALGATI